MHEWSHETGEAAVGAASIFSTISTLHTLCIAVPNPNPVAYLIYAHFTDLHLTLFGKVFNIVSAFEVIRE